MSAHYRDRLSNGAPCEQARPGSKMGSKQRGTSAGDLTCLAARLMLTQRGRLPSRAGRG